MLSTRFFVVGATGQIGTGLCRRLRRGGHEVVELPRSSDAAVALAAYGLEPFHGDLDRMDAVVARAREADVTIFAP